MGYPEEKVSIFIKESNAIELEYSKEAIHSSLNAWNHIRNLKKLTIEDLLTCHLLIMGNIRPDIAGKLRVVDAYVGNAKGYPPHAINQAIKEWLVTANTVDMIDEIKESHIWFEIIHPFADGNGRTGRMVLLWQSQKAVLPFAVIKADTKHENYYPWFAQARYIGKYRFKEV